MAALKIKVDEDELKELYGMIYEGFSQWFVFNKPRKDEQLEQELLTDD